MRRLGMAVVSSVLSLSLSHFSTGAPVPQPSNGSSSSRPSRAPDASGPLGRPRCSPASPIRTAPLPEVRATPEGTTRAYGLIFADLPLVSGPETVKFVWRITGRGLLDLSVAGPGGETKPLAWGPELHAESSYHRPGEEWGMGVVLSEPGCWEVRLRRSSGTARVWFDVGAPEG